MNGDQILNLIFVLTTLLSSVTSLSTVTQSCGNGTSTFQRSYQNVLSRKKRFLIFPKGANIINTALFGKQVVSGFPRGFATILELDIFWPLPFEPRLITNAKDLLFGKAPLHKKNIPPWLVEPKKPSYSTYPPQLLHPTPDPWKEIYLDYDPTAQHGHGWESIPDHHTKWKESSNHPGEIWMPPSGWQGDVIQSIKDQEGHRRSWNVTANNKPVGLKSKYGPYNKYRGSNRNSAQFYQNSINNQYKPRGRSYKFSNNQETSNRAPPASDNDVDTDPSPHWEHYYAQKDRREIYDIIHVAFAKLGIDVTACLQRTICEVKHFLKPQGKSLLHDVFRVFFTYPIHDLLEDKYAEAARASSGDDCAKIYGQVCRISILDFVLYSGKVF